jgi:hypothetical protein
MGSVTLRGRVVQTTSRSNVLRDVVLAMFAVIILGLALYAIDRRNAIQASLPVLASARVLPPPPEAALGETPGPDERRNENSAGQ